MSWLTGSQATRAISVSIGQRLAASHSIFGRKANSTSSTPLTLADLMRRHKLPARIHFTEAEKPHHVSQPTPQQDRLLRLPLKYEASPNLLSQILQPHLEAFAQSLSGSQSQSRSLETELSVSSTWVEALGRSERRLSGEAGLQALLYGSLISPVNSCLDIHVNTDLLSVHWRLVGSGVGPRTDFELVLVLQRNPLIDCIIAVFEVKSPLTMSNDTSSRLYERSTVSGGLEIRPADHAYHADISRQLAIQITYHDVQIGILTNWHDYYLLEASRNSTTRSTASPNVFSLSRPVHSQDISTSDRLWNSPFGFLLGASLFALDQKNRKLRASDGSSSEKSDGRALLLDRREACGVPRSALEPASDDPDSQRTSPSLPSSPFPRSGSATYSTMQLPAPPPSRTAGGTFTNAAVAPPPPLAAGSSLRIIPSFNSPFPVIEPFIVDGPIHQDALTLPRLSQRKSTIHDFPQTLPSLHLSDQCGVGAIWRGVFRADATSQVQRVAKVSMLADFADTEFAYPNFSRAEALASIINENRVLHALAGSGITPQYGGLYAGEVAEGVICLAVQEYGGRPLLPQELALHWIRPAIRELYQELHAQGILHGDVRWPNILRGPIGRRVYLVDFGMSRMKRSFASDGEWLKARDEERENLESLLGDY